MRILLQHERTGLYLCESGDWTRDPDGAMDFGHTQKVIEHVRQTGLRGVHIAVRFSESEHDEIFPIPPPARVAVAMAVEA
jgi:hypothetical protein